MYTTEHPSIGDKILFPRLYMTDDAKYYFLEDIDGIIERIEDEMIYANVSYFGEIGSIYISHMIWNFPTGKWIFNNS